MNIADRSRTEYYDPSPTRLSRFVCQDADAFLQAVLVRYYTNHLGHWFDLNDPLRHFTMIVPLRSQQPRPLLHAIMTAAARQLIRIRRHRNKDDVVSWQGHVLPQLDEKMALQFQNECIRELLQLSDDPQQVIRAELLAAAVILRTDEELDARFRNEGPDEQIFLSAAHAYIDAQVTAVMSPSQGYGSPESLDTPGSRSATGPPEIPDPAGITGSRGVSSPEHQDSIAQIEDTTSRSLRQASFWAACRQDVHAALIWQRPINFPLPYCHAQRSLMPAEDHVWTVRTIVFCADVLEFCYGRHSGQIRVAPAYANGQRWHTLKQRHTDIIARLPRSFTPTYTREPDSSRSEAFPQIWFQDPCYATGHGHLELAHMLLTVFDPTAPKLGLDHHEFQSRKRLQLKEIVLRLCGIAISNPSSPPNFINAFTAISLCGGDITELPEQYAILQLLNSMQLTFAYDTHKVADKLRSLWNMVSSDVNSA